MSEVSTATERGDVRASGVDWGANAVDVARRDVTRMLRRDAMVDRYITNEKLVIRNNIMNRCRLALADDHRFERQLE